MHGSVHVLYTIYSINIQESKLLVLTSHLQSCSKPQTIINLSKQKQVNKQISVSLDPINLNNTIHVHNITVIIPHCINVSHLPFLLEKMVDLCQQTFCIV